MLNTHEMKKHFDLEITDAGLSFARKTGGDRRRRLPADGIYVVRTSLAEDTLGGAENDEQRQTPEPAERGFRCIKTVDLGGPAGETAGWSDRVRCEGASLCRRADYLEWHMRQQLAPMQVRRHGARRRPQRSVGAWWHLGAAFEGRR